MGREKKRIKISFAHEQFCIFAHFYNTNVGVFWVKMCKIEHFCILQIFTITDVVALR